MATFEHTLEELAALARSGDAIGSRSIDGIVQSYLARIDGDKSYERNRLANAFAERCGRNSDRFDFIYRRLKGSG